MSVRRFDILKKNPGETRAAQTNAAMPEESFPATGWRRRGGSRRELMEVFDARGDATGMGWMNVWWIFGIVL